MTKTGTLLAATLALTGFPLMAQQPPQADQPTSPPTQQASPAEQPASPAPATPEQAAPQQAEPSASQSPQPEASAPQAPIPEMRPVPAELVSKLDTKTAKTGDDVVVQTKAAVKTADGTEIPKGSKVDGHVLAVLASADGQNSQVVLVFDRAELTGGQSLPIHTEIQSIGATNALAARSSAANDSATPTEPSGGAASGSGSTSAATPGGGATTPGGGAVPPASSGQPAPGTVVGRNGKIAIRTTAIPGILLANNDIGQQDPRMSRASSILLGAKQDVQLDGGTQMVLGVATTGPAK